MNPFRNPYLAAVDRTTTLIQATPDRLTTRIPACPAWNARDILGHLAGIAEDWVSGRFDGYATEQWTTAQVARHADDSIDELIATWRNAVQNLDEVSHPTLGEPWKWLFGDALTHEGDLREHLDPATRPPLEAIESALPPIIARWRHHLRSHELAPLQLRVVGVRDWWIGEPAEHFVRLDIDPFTLWRLLYGRLPWRDAIRLDWHGDAMPYLNHGLPFPFTFPRTDSP